jgi:hypothetical protein
VPIAARACAATAAVVNLNVETQGKTIKALKA